MNNYYFIDRNADAYNNHLLHSYGCQLLPSYNSREYLGYFSSEVYAVDRAKEVGFTGIIFCPRCCQ